LNLVTPGEKLSSRWRRRIISTLQWLSVAFIALLLFIYIYEERQKFLRLMDITLPYLILLACLCGMLFIPTAASRKSMGDKLGFGLSINEWYGISIYSNLSSFVLPSRGDALLVAAYLKSRKNFPVSYFATMTLGNAILMAAILLMVALISLIVYGMLHSTWHYELMLLSCLALLVVLSLFLIDKIHLRQAGRTARVLGRALTAWRLIRTDRMLMVKLILLIITGTAIFVAWTYYSYIALGFPVDLVSMIFIGVIMRMSFLVSLTPGNLGIRELVLGATSDMLGLGFTEGVAVTLLQRAVSLLVMTVLALLYLPMFRRSGRYD